LVHKISGRRAGAKFLGDGKRIYETGKKVRGGNPRGKDLMGGEVYKGEMEVPPSDNQPGLDESLQDLVQRRKEGTALVGMFPGNFVALTRVPNLGPLQGRTT